MTPDRYTETDRKRADLNAAAVDCARQVNEQLAEQTALAYWLAHRYRGDARRQPEQARNFGRAA